MKYQSDREAFLKWYAGFSSGNYFPILKNPAGWFDKLEESHQAIREKLGGVNKIVEIHISDEHAVSEASYDDCRYQISALKTYLPALFNTYNYRGQELCVPLSPRGMKWGKVFSQWMDKHHTSDASRAAINKTLAELGEIWARNKVSQKKMYMNITTEPMAFAKIGHFGVDAGSCFGVGGLNEIHKLIIGQTPGSFVGLVGNDKCDVESQRACPRTRFWGFADEDFKAFHTCNIYPRTPTNGGDILVAMKLGFKNIIGEDVEVTNDRVVVSGVYHNNDSSRSYHVVGHDTARTIKEINTNDAGIEQYRKCMLCGKFKGEHEEFENFHLAQYCLNCVSRYGADRCPITNERLYENITVHDPQRGDIKVALKARLLAYPRCELDRKYYHVSEMALTKGNLWVYKGNIEKYDMVLCEHCNRAREKEETECGCTDSQSVVVEESVLGELVAA